MTTKQSGAGGRQWRKQGGGYSAQAAPLPARGPEAVAPLLYLRAVPCCPCSQGSAPMPHGAQLPQLPLCPVSRFRGRCLHKGSSLQGQVKCSLFGSRVGCSVLWFPKHCVIPSSSTCSILHSDSVTQSSLCRGMECSGPESTVPLSSHRSTQDTDLVNPYRIDEK